MAAAAVEQRDFVAEFRIRLPEGGIRWLGASARAVVDADGRTTAYVGTLTDISDRKRAGRRLYRYSLDVEDARARVEEQATPWPSRPRNSRSRGTRPWSRYG